MEWSEALWLCSNIGLRFCQTFDEGIRERFFLYPLLLYASNFTVISFFISIQDVLHAAEPAAVSKLSPDL